MAPAAAAAAAAARLALEASRDMWGLLLRGLPQSSGATHALSYAAEADDQRMLPPSSRDLPTLGRRCCGTPPRDCCCWLVKLLPVRMPGESGGPRLSGVPAGELQ
jgi:hypothetical protein